MFKRLTMPNVEEDGEQLERYLLLLGGKMLELVWRAVWLFLNKLNMYPS